MLYEIFTPPALPDYVDYFKTVLSIAGVLFGLTFTALIFVMQSGFSSFTFSRRMFLELYVLFGSNLLVNLSYLTLMPLAAAYMGSYRLFLSMGYCLFACAFIKTLMDLHKHRGYIHTTFSTAIVPAGHGPVHTYFRYIYNLGPVNFVALLLHLVVVIGYPIAVSFYESGSMLLTAKGVFYSTGILLLFSVFQVSNFVHQFFITSNRELEIRRDDSTEESNGTPSNIDYAAEKLVLREFLFGHGYRELNHLDEVAFLDGTVALQFLTEGEGEEAWFNINVRVQNVTVPEIRQAVAEYTFNLIRTLNNSMVDINSFALSFHIRIGNDNVSRGVFFRVNRAEMPSLLGPGATAESVWTIRNKLVDELLRA